MVVWVPGAAPQCQALGNTVQRGLGRAEKDQLENEDPLIMEHLSELFKSKTTVAPKAGAFYSPGREKRLRTSPHHVCAQVQ